MLVPVDIIFLKIVLQMISANIKGCLDNGLGRRVADGLGIGTFTQDERECAQDNGFAGTSLTGNNGQPIVKPDF